jgi:uncharacterized protein YacL
MKRLPIYGLLIAGYTIILIGVSKLYKDLAIIEIINVPQTQEYKIDIVPAIIIGIFLLIIALSLGVYLITELWKYFWTHKQLLPIPFLLIALGFLNLTTKIMQGVSVMIQSNAETFTQNLATYTSAFNTLGTYTIIGLACLGLSVAYSILLKRGIIFPQTP